MAYYIGDKKIRQDRPFKHNGIQYPSNWLRLSTPEDKQAIGMVWRVDNPSK